MIEFNKNANVIYKDAGEKNVAAVVLYPNGEPGAGPNCLYWVKLEETPINLTAVEDIIVKADELADLAMKGLALIEVAENKLLPIVGIELNCGSKGHTKVHVSDTTCGVDGVFTSTTLLENA